MNKEHTQMDEKIYDMVYDQAYNPEHTLLSGAMLKYLLDYDEQNVTNDRIVDQVAEQLDE